MLNANSGILTYITAYLILLGCYRLMRILLPPVPVPKIKGIDPELLKVRQHVSAGVTIS